MDFLINWMPWAAPEILLTALGACLLVMHAANAPSPKAMGGYVIAGLCVILFLTWMMPLPQQSNAVDPVVYFWSGTYRWDVSAKFFKLFFLVTAILVTWLSLEDSADNLECQSEFYILPLFVTAGLCTLASINDFVLLFVALELVTISFYILVAYHRRSAMSLEAGVKYLIMGGVSSAFLVMGIAYVFGITGSTNFNAIGNLLARVPEMQSLGILPPTFEPLGLQFGLLLVLVGLSFKAGAVPFHSWAPDVYQGAPSPITAFLSVGSKAAAFVALLCIIIGSGLFLPFADSVGFAWGEFIEITAILSMLLGNLAALPQRNIKRMLAYSSIGHSGFLLIPIAAYAFIGPNLEDPALKLRAFQLFDSSRDALMVYLFAYLLATFLSFLVITVVARQIPGEQIHSYAGLWKRSPLLALAMTIGLASMAGIPPLIGFVGKLAVFVVAWQIGWLTGSYLLFWVGVVAAVAGLYYYAGVIKTMYWSEPLDGDTIRVSGGTAFVLVVLIIATILLGFWTGGIDVISGGLFSPTVPPAAIAGP